MLKPPIVPNSLLTAREAATGEVIETPDLLTTAKRLGLRPKEAAKALGISERLLWAKTNCGEIPHCRIGRAIVYPVHLLEDYLTTQAKGGDSL